MRLPHRFVIESTKSVPDLVELLQDQTEPFHMFCAWPRSTCPFHGSVGRNGFRLFLMYRLACHGFYIPFCGRFESTPNGTRVIVRISSAVCGILLLLFSMLFAALASHVQASAYLGLFSFVVFCALAFAAVWLDTERIRRLLESIFTDNAERARRVLTRTPVVGEKSPGAYSSRATDGLTGNAQE
jgi:hypothetical protein